MLKMLDSMLKMLIFNGFSAFFRALSSEMPPAIGTLHCSGHRLFIQFYAIFVLNFDEFCL